MSTSSQKPVVTAFAETGALWAVMNKNDVEARRIIADLFPNERAEFAAQLDRLRAMLTDRFGNDVATNSGPRVRVLDDEGRFLARRTVESEEAVTFPPRGGHDATCAYVSGMTARCTCSTEGGAS
ncbi:hypothetical protein [Streptomyces violaceus]|uniref:Uncharacterized protein n=1 Tax=Streptomyces violaceus TaxID=1936 RepID=A0ABZ1NM49_STRVL